MKKIIFVLTCLLLVSACGRQTEAPPGAADCGGGPPNRIDEQFESVDELLDFVAAIDPKTYPEGYSEQHSGPAGDLEPLVSALQQDGYLLLLRSDDPGPAEQEPRYVVSSMDSHFGEMYQVYDTYVGEWLLCLEVSAIPEALWDKAEQGVLEYAEACGAKVAYPDTWEKSGAYVNAYLDEVTVNGEKVPCLVNISVRSAPRIHFVWEHKALSVGFVRLTGQTENPQRLDLSPMEKVTLEKVPLPDAEEARARVEQREKEAAAREEAALAEAAAEEAEALLGPPKAESFPLSREELLAFLNTVDAAAYPAAGDRGEGKLLPLITQIREEAYVWLPSVDGVPAEPKAGYYTVKSLGTHSLPEYSVEGFLAGDPTRVYNLYVTYPDEEARVLLEKSVETFRQGQGGQTVTAENWKGKEYIADYREAEFMLNGEKLTGVTMTGVLSSDPDHWRTHLWFYYDGKLMELNTYEAPEPSFDLSMFEGLTLKKIPLN